MLSLSNTLIIISAIFTIATIQTPFLYNFWMNLSWIILWDYLKVFFQFLLYSFLHWWILHLLSNSIFIYIFWNQVEYILWFKKYLIFFILATIFNWVSILLLSAWNTVWISWFCMALLAFYTISLYKNWNPDYKWWITALIINVLIWFVPGISLVWHLFWAIFWIIFYFIDKYILSKVI